MTIQETALNDTALRNFNDDGFATQMEAYKEACERLAKTEVSEATKGIFADLRITKRQLAKAAEEIKVAEKAPLLAATRAIDATYNGRISTLDTLSKEPLDRFDAWLIAEDERLKAEARARREAAERAEAEAAAKRAEAEAALDPFEAFDAAERADEATTSAAVAAHQASAASAARVRVASDDGIGRALSVRTTQSVEVVDYALAFPTVANNKAVKEAIDKAVRAAFKATGEAPAGCKIVEAKAVR